MARRWELSLSSALRLAPRQALLVLPSHDSAVRVHRHLDRRLAIAGLGEARFLALGAPAPVSALGPASLPGRKLDRSSASAPAPCALALAPQAGAKRQSLALMPRFM